MKIEIKSLSEINNAARKFIEQIGGNTVFALYGAMGAGKTTFIKAVCEELGVEETITSPTFAIVNEYKDGDGDSIYHFDFYRFATPEEFFGAGLDEYFDGTGVCLVEWPEKAAPHTPAPDLTLALAPRPDGSREARLTASTPRASECLDRLAPSR